VPRSKCLDGSPAGFYHSPSQSSRGRLRWVLYLEGGGLCFTKADCESRTTTALGSSKYFALTRVGRGVQAVDAATNPDFWDANHVFVPYCTGDLHTGTHTNASDATINLFFSGHSNLEAI